MRRRTLQVYGTADTIGLYRWPGGDGPCLRRRTGPRSAGTALLPARVLRVGDRAPEALRSEDGGRPQRRLARGRGHADSGPAPPRAPRHPVRTCTHRAAPGGSGDPVRHLPAGPLHPRTRAAARGARGARPRLCAAARAAPTAAAPAAPHLRAGAGGALCAADPAPADRGCGGGAPDVCADRATVVHVLCRGWAALGHVQGLLSSGRSVEDQYERSTGVADPDECQQCVGSRLRPGPGPLPAHAHGASRTTGASFSRGAGTPTGREGTRPGPHQEDPCTARGDTVDTCRHCTCEGQGGGAGTTEGAVAFHCADGPIQDATGIPARCRRGWRREPSSTCDHRGRSHRVGINQHV
mmetsp:Transcript_4480/g.9394  ORF Transcript_4480/g.9394 Transcript_4480/m.9394 type:complete len:353 (+) Transcript_4480:375-1433(+)